MKNPEDYIVKLSNGRLGAIEFPDNPAILSKVVKILTEDYINNGGQIKK